MGHRRDRPEGPRAKLLYLVGLARQRKWSAESLYSADEFALEPLIGTRAPREARTLVGTGRYGNLRRAANPPTERPNFSHLFGERQLDGGLLPGAFRVDRRRPAQCRRLEKARMRFLKNGSGLGRRALFFCSVSGRNRRLDRLPRQVQAQERLE